MNQDRNPVADLLASKRSFNSRASKMLALGFIVSLAVMVSSLTFTAYHEIILSGGRFTAHAQTNAHPKVLGAAITNGLVAYWGFDEGSGTIAADSSGNNNSGTLIGNPNWTTGKINSGLQFNGSSSYVNGPSTINFPSGPFSLAAWFKTSASPANGRILAKWTSFSNINFEVYLDNGQVTGLIYDGGYRGVTTSTTYNDGQWHHVALVVDTTKFELFVDGASKGTATHNNSIPTNTTTNVTIGAAPNVGSYFNGFIDEAYVFNRALSASEVNTLVGVTGSGDTTPPSVALTSPSSGATLSGTTTVSANASDNIGVVGIQFKVDGNNSGSEDISAPYSINLDTTALSNGSHAITAIARDAAGNSTVSAAVSVTVNNSVQTVPVISSFSSSPSSITSGQSSILSWSVTGATSLSINNVGSVTGSSVSVNPSASTTYTLTATNSAGSVTANTTVTVTAAPPTGGSCSGANCITLDSAQTLQTIDGWECTAQIGHRYLSATAWNNVKNNLYDQIIDLGINRIRVEVNSGLENPTDYYTQWLNGQITENTMNANRYNIINDNTDSSSINPVGFQWSKLDDQIDNIVLPLKQRLAAQGEQLYLNANYVDFGSSAFEHKTNPAEYAEFVLATYQHMQTRYGFVPDSWEVILEPDTAAAGWTVTQVGNAIKAAGDRLSAAGFTPRFIAPSTTNGWEILPLANGGNNWAGNLIAMPGVGQYIDTISYHRYTSPTQAQTQVIGNMTTQYGKKTAMLEFIGADYNILHMDLKDGRNSSWQQYTLAFPDALDNGAQYFTYTSANPVGTLALGSRSKFLRQYFKYVRRNAVRIGAVSGNATFDPLAYRNTDGKHVVVVKAAGSGTFGINGLPAGTYKIFYTTASAYDQQLVSQTISTGQSVNVTMPAAGVITIYASGGTPPPTGDTTPPSVSITAPAPGATINGSYVITTSTSDNVGVVGVQFKVDGLNIGNEVTTSPFLANWQTSTVANGNHTLTAIARDAAGNTAISASVNITVNNGIGLPVISSFTANPASISVGQFSTLSWSGTGATSLSIDQGIGSVTGSTSRVVTPSTTTTYTLTATNSYGSVTASTTVTLGAQQPPPSGSVLYVAPNGLPSGNGSLNLPWDLQTAMNQPSSVTNGKTIYMRGGTYQGKFISNLTGATLRSYPGEWAKIDGYYPTTTAAPIAQVSVGIRSDVQLNGNFQMATSMTFFVDNELMQIDTNLGNGVYRVNRGWGGTAIAAHNTGALVRLTGNTIILNGSDTVYRDFEVMNSNPNRAFFNTSGYAGDVRGEGEGFMIYGDNLKIINIVIHDNADGLLAAESADSLEVYGIITYNNGHVAVDRGHGHGMYIQNVTADDYYKEIISFNNFASGMKGYGASQGHSNNLHFEGIISFNNGSPGQYAGTPNSNNELNRRQSNIFIGSDVYPSTNVSVKNSYIYHAPGMITELGGMSFGRAPSGGNSGAVVTDNFLVDPYNGYNFDKWSNVTFTGNTAYLSGKPTNIAVNEVLVGANGTFSNFNVNNNTYYDQTTLSTNCNSSGARHSFYATGVTYTCNNGTPISALPFNTWKQGTGFDATSTYIGSRPTGKNIFVRPNVYEPGRANIAVYNWDLSSTVTVSLNSAGLTPGQRFEIRSAENYMGAPVLSNQTYSAGMSVTLPSASRTVATPIGHVFTPASTCPEFCTYVVVPLSAGVQQPTDTTAPAVSIVSPAAGATLSGTAVITVSATDNIGVTGVQWKVDGLNIGGEVTSSPFSANFNTTTVANGAHTLTVVARDAAGNTTTSSPVSITVNNATVPVINSFVASPASINVGQVSTLSWSTTGATSVSISGLGTVTGTSVTVSPTTTTTYTLTVTNSAGSATRTVTVTVSSINQRPIGSLDGVNSTTGTVFGWTQDSDNQSVPVTVHIYFDRNAGTTGATPISYLANENRSDVGNHAFNFPIPSQYRDGLPHQVWVWAIDLTDPASNNTQLAGSPKSFTITVQDTTPPVISNITATQGANEYKKAIIKWTTDEPATSQVEFGTTTAYGTTTPVTTTLTTNHQVVIGPIVAGTLYHFRVQSRDIAGNLATSTDQTFTAKVRPAKPPRTSSLSFSAGSIVLSWGTIDFDLCEAVEVHRSATVVPQTATSSTLLVSLNCSATGYSDTAVIPGTTYYYSVFIKDDSGIYSDPQSGSFAAPITPTLPTTPTTPTTTTTPTIPTTSPTVILPANAIAGQVIKFGNSPIIFLVQTTGLHPFDSYSSFQQYASQSGAQVILRSGSADAYTVSSVFAREVLNQTPSQTPTLPPNGSRIICAGNGTIYYYNNGMREGYSEPAVYEAWNGKNYSGIIIVDAATCATITDNGLARLPQGTIVRVTGGREIYRIENITARPFTSYSAYTRDAADKTVYTISLPLLHTYSRGTNIY